MFFLEIQWNVDKTEQMIDSGIEKWEKFLFAVVRGNKENEIYKIFFQEFGNINVVRTINITVNRVMCTSEDDNK